MLFVTVIDHRLFILGRAFPCTGNVRCLLKDRESRLGEVFLQLVSFVLKMSWTFVSIIAQVAALRLKVVRLNGQLFS